MCFHEAKERESEVVWGEAVEEAPGAGRFNWILRRGWTWQAGVSVSRVLLTLGMWSVFAGASEATGSLWVGVSFLLSSFLPSLISSASSHHARCWSRAGNAAVTG